LRHWCFLEKITDSITLHHLELKLADINKKRIPLHFNTPSQGSELNMARIQKSYTVAVFYAERHTFTYGDPGIKLKDPQILKVCKTNSNTQHSFTYTDVIEHYKDLPDIVEQVARTN
jgi:hypothetical protein